MRPHRLALLSFLFVSALTTSAQSGGAAPVVTFTDTAVHPGTHYLGVDGEVIKKFDPMPPPYPLGWTPSVVFSSRYQMAVPLAERSSTAQRKGARRLSRSPSTRVLSMESPKRTHSGRCCARSRSGPSLKGFLCAVPRLRSAGRPRGSSRCSCAR